MPRMLTYRPSPVSIESETPGIRPRASEALKSGYLAIVSADWTLTMFGASRCTTRAVDSSLGAVITTPETPVEGPPVSVSVSASTAPAKAALLAAAKSKARRPGLRARVPSLCHKTVVFCGAISDRTADFGCG